MNRRQLLQRACALPLLAARRGAQAAAAARRGRGHISSLPAGGRGVAFRRIVGKPQPGSRRSPRRRCFAAVGVRRRARGPRVHGRVQGTQEPVLHRRQHGAHADLRLDRWLDIGAERLCGSGAQHGGRRARGQLRARAPAAACGEGRRPQLPRNVERGGLAAHLHARDERDRDARRVRRRGLRRHASGAAGRHCRGRQHLDADLSRDRHRGRPLCAGRRLRDGWRRRLDPERRLRQLFEALRHGRGVVPPSRNRHRRWEGAHRQCLHESRTSSGR